MPRPHEHDPVSAGSGENCDDLHLFELKKMYSTPAANASIQE